MIDKSLQKYIALRQKYPDLIPQEIMQKVRPFLWYALDFCTMNLGCKVRCAGKWSLNVEWKRKIKHNFEQWEREFIDVYISTLHSDDVVFDIGAEYGEWAALAATIVGGSKVHIFEPNIPAWRRIQKVWHHNRLSPPGGCWAGFVSNQSSLSEINIKDLSMWPESNKGEVEFETLLKNKNISAITIDDYVFASGVTPTVLMMDIEGAEGLALKGAINTLSNFQPIVFVSLHPTMLPQFNFKIQDIMDIFSSLHYNSHLISIDHEEHWVFWHPCSRQPVLTLQKV
jgi:hypothetical protein